MLQLLPVTRLKGLLAALDSISSTLLPGKHYRTFLLALVGLRVSLQPVNSLILPRSLPSSHSR